MIVSVEHIKSLYRYVPSFVYLYFTWISLHYLSAHLYTTYCTPGNLYGFIASPFMITLPHCQAFRWIIHTSGDTIMNMWLLLGAWFILRLQIKQHTA